jgi:hypothetical protein
MVRPVEPAVLNVLGVNVVEARAPLGTRHAFKVRLQGILSGAFLIFEEVRSGGGRRARGSAKRFVGPKCRPPGPAQYPWLKRFFGGVAFKALEGLPGALFSTRALPARRLAAGFRNAKLLPASGTHREGPGPGGIDPERSPAAATRDSEHEGLLEGEAQ